MDRHVTQTEASNRSYTRLLGLVGLLALAGGCADPGDGSSGSETATATADETDVGTTNPSTGGETDSTAVDTEVETTEGTSGETDSETGVDTLPPGPWDQGVVLPPGEQVPGDPEAGYDALLNNGYVTCGIPYTLFQLGKGALGTFADGDPLPGRVGKNAEVPYNWTVHDRNGADITSLNCLTCHAGKINGELVLGLGRVDIDYTDNLGETLGGIPVPDLPILGLDELAKFVARYKAIGPFIQMKTVGTNPADMLAVLLASHRDAQTLNWSDEPLVEIPHDVIAVDTPPWWRVKKKNALFANGMARGDHRGTMMFASSLCTDTVAEAESVMSYFNDINAYIQSLTAPVYPFAIDAELAAEGEPLFVANCSGCHGTYASDPELETYPNKIFPLDLVGTDPVVASYASNDVRFMVDWYNMSYYGTLTQIDVETPFPGYVAPPLDGVWATAPFFHNASVPTLELVLNSEARPTYWKRVDFDSTNFDKEDVGWPYIELAYGQADASDEERRYIYDTTVIAHGNGGHSFGDHLSPSERRAVVEYLKTL